MPTTILAIIPFAAFLAVAAMGEALVLMSRGIDLSVPAIITLASTVVLGVSGGVAANRLLRRRLQVWAGDEGVDLRLVRLCYSSDNAAMIAFNALLRQGWGLADDPLRSEAASRIPI